MKEVALSESKHIPWHEKQKNVNVREKLRCNSTLTSSFRLLTSSTPLAPVCPDRATLPAAAAAAAAALNGLRAPGNTQVGINRHSRPEVKLHI